MNSPRFSRIPCTAYSLHNAVRTSFVFLSTAASVTICENVLKTKVWQYACKRKSLAFDFRETLNTKHKKTLAEEIPFKTFLRWPKVLQPLQPMLGQLWMHSTPPGGIFPISQDFLRERLLLRAIYKIHPHLFYLLDSPIWKEKRLRLPEGSEKNYMYTHYICVCIYRPAAVKYFKLMFSKRNSI